MIEQYCSHEQVRQVNRQRAQKERRFCPLRNDRVFEKCFRVCPDGAKVERWEGDCDKIYYCLHKISDVEFDAVIEFTQTLRDNQGELF